jgi:ferritin-like metal-binding protein YciE
MNLENPTDLFFDQIRDLYSAESQVILTLPELAQTASHTPLRNLLEEHEETSQLQKQRLQRIAERWGQHPGGDLCKAIQGLIEGGNAHLARTADPQVADLMLIAHCNRIKHYEIAGYGFALSLADVLGRGADARELAATLDEEKEFTESLARQAAANFGLPLARVG